MDEDEKEIRKIVKLMAEIGLKRLKVGGTEYEIFEEYDRIK